MLFEATAFEGAWLVRLQPVRDERGFFARTYCSEKFEARGLEAHYPQHSISFSEHRSTLRGMHYQSEPHSEVKVVRCTRGIIWDVIIDLRRDSPTYLKWQGFELSESDDLQLYIPKGIAHGFQTLSDDVEVSYLISEPYAKHAASGVRYNDPSFGIPWPLPITVISDKDMNWPDFIG